MKNEKKTRWRWETLAVCFTLLLGFSSFFFLEGETGSQGVQFDNETSYLISDGWTVETDGIQQSISLPARAEAKASEAVTFSRKLEEPDTFCNAVLFRSYHQFVRVFLGEELIYSYGQEAVGRLHRSPGSAWQLVRLPEGYAGKQLKIELTAVYDGEAGMISDVWLGTKSGLVFCVADQVKYPLLLNIPVFLMGLLLVICSFFFHDRQSVRKIRSLGLFCLVISAWILSESRVSQFLTGNMPAALDAVFLFFDAIPVFAIYFLQSCPEFGTNRRMKVLMAASVINYLVAQVMNMTGAESYMQSVWRVHLLIVLVLAEFIYTYAEYKRHRKKAEDPTLFRAAFYLACFGALDILKYYLDPETKDVTFFTRLGLICFVLVLGISVLRRESRKSLEQAKQAVLQKLAYMDLMTGLANRTAFEEEMQRCREERSEAALVILVADLNGLKYINDHYGHSTGDIAIKKMAELLERCFGDTGKCYRIGGDEFCVIAKEDESEKACGERPFGERVSEFEKRLKQTGVAKDVVLCAACGWERGKRAEADDIFRSADGKMYLQKAKMRSEGENKEG